MKTTLTFVFCCIFSALIVQAQNTIQSQSSLTKNFKQFEFELLNGEKYNKLGFERWKLSKKDGKLSLHGTIEQSIQIDASFLDGSSLFSVDKYTWTNKSPLHLKSINNSSNTILSVNFNEITNIL